MQFSIIPYGTPAYAEILALREEILRKPLGIGFTAEEIAAEKDWVHMAAYLDGTLCGTAAVVFENNNLAKVCRVAVRADRQGKGTGTKLMHYVESYAAQQGIREIYVHARDMAVPFYLKNQS